MAVCIPSFDCNADTEEALQHVVSSLVDKPHECTTNIIVTLIALCLKLAYRLTFISACLSTQDANTKENAEFHANLVFLQHSKTKQNQCQSWKKINAGVGEVQLERITWKKVNSNSVLLPNKCKKDDFANCFNK